MKEPNAPSTESEEKKAHIVDLTPDMELKDETKGKIIDLIDARFSPSGDTTQVPPVKHPIQTENADTASEESEDHMVIASPDKVEADVDAAFEMMQEKASDEEPEEPEMSAETEEDEIDLSDTLNDLSTDDVTPLPPVEETTTADEELEEEEEPELELFQEPADEAPPAPPAADPEAPKDAKPGDSSIDLESRLDDVDAGDTIELTDVVVPVDLDTPLASDTDPEESRLDASDLEPSLDPLSTDLVDREEADPMAPFEAEEDAIELTDIVETETAPDARPGSEVEALQQDGEDEDVIELTDRVDPEALEQAEDDEVIELVDIVDPSELGALPEAVAGASQEEPWTAEDDDDDVIELTDIVEMEEPAAAGSAGLEADTPAPETVEEILPMPPEPAEDKVIRLDSVLDHVRQNKSQIAENMSHGLEEAIGDPPTASDTEEGGIDMHEVREALGEPSELTDKELEEAIEKIIRTKYAETIEKHIAAVVERVVTREMESIKRSLMEDQEPDE